MECCMLWVVNLYECDILLWPQLIYTIGSKPCIHARSIYTCVPMPCWAAITRINRCIYSHYNAHVYAYAIQIYLHSWFLTQQRFLLQYSTWMHRFVWKHSVVVVDQHQKHYEELTEAIDRQSDYHACRYSGTTIIYWWLLSHWHFHDQLAHASYLNNGPMVSTMAAL